MIYKVDVGTWEKGKVLNMKLLLILLSLSFFYACGECESDPLGNLHKCHEGEFKSPPIQYEVFGQTVRFEDDEGPSKECYIFAMQVVEIEAKSLTPKSVIGALKGFHIGWYNNIVTRGNRKAYGFSHSLNKYIQSTYDWGEAEGLPKSTWVHEIGHMIQELLLDRSYLNSDYDHEDAKVWNWVLNTEQVVARETHALGLCEIE